MAFTALTTRNEPPPIARGGWLDALRFIVAALIILHHFQGAGPIALAEGLHPAFEHTGFLLTNFFIIDSGYVLMRVYGRSVGAGRMSHSDFFLKRALRVWPAHLIMGLSLVVLVLSATLAGQPPRNPEWFRWDQLPAQLALVQSFGVHGGLGWNAPSWSISGLIGCYLLFPFILRGVTKLGPWTALSGMVGLYLIINQLCWTFLGYPVWQMPMQYGFIRILPLFVLGMTLACFAQKVWINPRLAGWVGVAAAVGFFALQAFDKHALWSLVCISLIILAAGTVPVRRPSKLVERAALVSFSMFITNEVVRIWWFGFANIAIARLNLSESVQWAIWGAGVLAALAFAWAYHHLIDAPMQDRIKAWLKARAMRRGRIARITQPVVSLEG